MLHARARKASPQSRGGHKRRWRSDLASGAREVALRMAQQIARQDSTCTCKRTWMLVEQGHWQDRRRQWVGRRLHQEIQLRYYMVGRIEAKEGDAVQAS